MQKTNKKPKPSFRRTWAGYIGKQSELSEPRRYIFFGQEDHEYCGKKH